MWWPLAVVINDNIVIAVVVDVDVDVAVGGWLMSCCATDVSLFGHKHGHMTKLFANRKSFSAISS